MEDYIKDNKWVLDSKNYPQINSNLISLDLYRVIREGHAKINGPQQFRNEYIQNITKNDWQTFCCVFDEIVKFEIVFKTPIFLRGYSFTATTDKPQRDPKKWSVALKKVNIHTNK